MTRTLAIIPAAILEGVNDDIWKHPAFQNKKQREFAVALYDINDTEETTPTHYSISHPFTGNQKSAVNQLKGKYPVAMMFDYTDPAFPAQKLIDLGLKVKTSSMA